MCVLYSREDDVLNQLKALTRYLNVVCGLISAARQVVNVEHVSYLAVLVIHEFLI